MENYFDKSEKQANTIKILIGIILLMLIINIGMFKSVLSIAGDKTFKFEVPSFLETGEYAIGTTFASKKVYKMWTKIWVKEMANFSHKDVRERTSNVIDFLAPKTAYKNKAQLLEFVDFVEENFVSQEFSPNDFEFNKTDKEGYYEVKWSGRLKRQIGLKSTPLTGLKYTYIFTCFARNGQIYIHNVNLERTDDKDVKIQRLLESNEFVNYELYSDKEKSKKGEKNEK